MTVCERIFRDFKFELPSTNVRRFVVSASLVDNPAAELKKVLAEHEKEEQAVARQLLRDFTDRFREQYKLTLSLTDAAADRLVGVALEKKIPVRELCAQKFKDFQFGLKLIAQNTGQQEFVIDMDVIEAPGKVLSDWVVKSYRSGASAPG
jgi:ATP-dependent Clp protease ATP-binding subunit ClpX